jgi:ParB-like chromosome segregation protein Spo0J
MPTTKKRKHAAPPPAPEPAADLTAHISALVAFWQDDLGTLAPGVVTALMHQPVSRIRWRHRETIRPNAYNPNKLAPPERELLIVSILEDGWTSPIVILPPTRPHSAAPSVQEIQEIVDGEHRWQVSDDARLVAIYAGMVPTVEVTADPVHRRMSTIRHNRARGTHAILPMADIVRDILRDGVTPKQVMARLGMEREEVARLSDRAGMPIRAGERESKGEFGKAWVPTPNSQHPEDQR